ncbi:hypothetical protein AAVH_34117 [Aphelenchoides avenae]|nr:hypothetical protein AAVH_34117 [Aphelenchus avenae]
MLASHSPYFKAMFFGDFTEAQKDEIELKDVPFDAWHEFYSVVYANCAVVNGKGGFEQYTIL